MIKNQKVTVETWRGNFNATVVALKDGLVAVRPDNIVPWMYMYLEGYKNGSHFMWVSLEEIQNVLDRSE